MSGHVIDAVVAEETEKAAGCSTRNQETVLHIGSSRGWRGALVCLKYCSFMDLAEYKEKEMPEDVWNIFSFGVFVLICKECKSFLMLK